MGAWAEDTFGNDLACDWIYDFARNPSLGAVQEAIESVVDTKDHVDSDEACICLAACEVLARLDGNWGMKNSYTEELDEWIEANPTSISSDLRESAKAAIDRILAPDSELLQLWDEGGRNEEWHDAVEDLRRRLN